MKRNNMKSRTGGMLVILTATLLIVAVIGVSMVALTQTSQHSELTANSVSRAYYLAESGLRYAQYLHCENAWPEDAPRSLILDGEEVIIEKEIAVDDDGNFLTGVFTATATVHFGTAMEARSMVEATVGLCPEPIVDGPGLATADGLDIDVKEGSLFEGNILVRDGKATIKGSVIGNVTATEVEFSGGGTIEGNIIAEKSVKITGGGTVIGNIHAGGNIEIGGGGEVIGSIYARGFVDLQTIVHGEVHSCESYVLLRSGTSGQNVRAAGNITLQGGAKIFGHADSGDTIDVNNNAELWGDATAWIAIKGGGFFGGGKFEGHIPAPPRCPDPFKLGEEDLPEPADFYHLVGDEDVTKSTTEPLKPGGYRDVNVGTDSQLHLESGAYYFRSIKFGVRGKLFLDLSSPEDIHIFVARNVDFGNDLTIEVLSPGETSYAPAFIDRSGDHIPNPNVENDLAAQVYMESHGGVEIKLRSEWIGTIYTPTGQLKVGNNSRLIGALYSGGTLEVGTHNHLIHVPSNYLNPPNE